MIRGVIAMGAMLALGVVLPACSGSRSAGEASSVRAQTIIDGKSPLGVRLPGMSQRSADLGLTFDGMSALFTCVGEPIGCDRGFHDALLAFNAAVPAGEGLRVELRVSPDRSGEAWSPWLTLATWGEGTRFAAPVRSFVLPTGQAGKIDIDYFTAPRPHLYHRLQYRLLATIPGVRVDRVSVALDDERGWTFRDTTREPSDARDSTVPFRTQKTPDAALSGRLCSPTSVAMVLAHHGVEVPVATVAEIARDPEFDLYGNWPRNIQAAASLGVPGFLTRISDWSQVDALFDQGLPIIASIQVSNGELPEAPYDSTGGHLIVLTGFTPEGDVHVNDPACGTEAEGRRVYSRKNLTNVWLSRTGGTAYVLLGRKGQMANEHMAK
ncbi:MAG: C39 family peptidase [Phycisphaerales bacterium]|nr:C39 family peptidase [Phycisphaerales bacterium]